MQTDSSSPQAPVARHTAALVLFSGGQDSTTCLAQALSLYERVETLGFDYGQRHSVEMQVRQQVRERLARDFPQWAPRLGEDHVLSLDVLQQIGGSSLTEDVAFAMQADGLPNTFVTGAACR
jgi:7-cyano-7-deazaguanine synthase